MSASQRVAAASDTEEPVREQLKKASIDPKTKEGLNGQQHQDELDSSTTNIPTSTNEFSALQNGSTSRASSSDRGRPPTRKRSHDDLEEDETLPKDHAPASGNERKRSRGGTAADKNISRGRASLDESRGIDEVPSSDMNSANGRVSLDESVRGRASVPSSEKGEETVEETLSPKIKRSRLHEAKQEERVESATTAEHSIPGSDVDAANKSADPVTKLKSTSTVEAAADPILESKETSKPKGSKPSIGFSDTGAASPFARVAESKSPTLEPQTSSSAFAASGFGALAGSSSSGFGSIAKTSGLSSFASPPSEAAGTEKKENAKPASSSAFGGALGSTSAFGAGGGSAFGGSTGFGKLGSGGFGGGGGGGGFGGAGSAGLSSFASPAGGAFGSSVKPARAFGAPLDEDDEEGSGDEDDAGALKSPRDTDEKKDERFFEQDVETGEENETTEYTCRAKLYNFVKADNDKKEWKERGLGTVRLNVQNVQGDGSTAAALKARLVMRADGSHRVILNTPIKKEINFGSVTGAPPTGGYIYFMGSIGDQPSLELLQLKLRQQFALELYDRIAELQQSM